MFEAFISILAILAASSSMTSCSGTETVGKDGFNFYKDYLRGGRSDDVIALAPTDERMLYFYRTPMQLHSSLVAAMPEQDHRKRTGNTFKNHMLNKEMWADSRVGRYPEKRTSKTALSLLMEKQHPFQMESDRYTDVQIIPM